MKKSTAFVILGIIFAIVLGSRLYFVLQTDDFSYDAYDELRQVKHVRETGKPIYDDELSYSGRSHLFSPFFYYLLAFFNLFMPLVIVAKVIPNILASLTIFIVFFISFEITKKYPPALISAFFSGFLLVFFTKTLNTISIYSLVVPLMFLITYCFLRIKEPRFLYLALILVLILVLTHVTAFILILALVFYFMIAKLENFRPLRKRVEFLLFLTFLVFWFNFIIYKKAFLAHGGSVIWQNIPSQILSTYFSQVTFLQAVYAIGVIPLIFGVYVVYHNFFEKKNRPAYFFIGFAMAIFIPLWFRLIALDVGLMFLGIILAIFGGVGMKLMIDYFNKTRFSKAGNYIVFFLLLLFLFTSVFPLINAATGEMKDRPTYHEKKALLWLKENTQEDAVVLATLEKGHVINYIAERKNIIDSNFLMIPLIDQRYDDIKLIFTTPYKTEAVRKLNQYDVTHIYFSPDAKEKYDIANISYIDDPECFTLLYDDTVQIYSVQCRID